MAKFGLTEERYAQMMETYDGDEEAIKEVVDDWGAESVNKGYELFVSMVSNDGMVQVERIDDVGAFDGDDEAIEQAIKDGIKIIPVDELPENFWYRFFGWVDTPENRKAIERWCNR